MEINFRCVVCNKDHCKIYNVYVRIKKQWVKIGLFHQDSNTIVLFDDIKAYVSPGSNLASEKV